MTLWWLAAAQQTLENRNIGASIHGWNFNINKKSHVLRAAQEGIVFALNYGLKIMRDMGTKLEIVKAGNANMFLSPLFAEAFATIAGATVELYNTDSSQDAARGAAIGAGTYEGPRTRSTHTSRVDSVRSTDGFGTTGSCTTWPLDVLLHQILTGKARHHAAQTNCGVLGDCESAGSCLPSRGLFVCPSTHLFVHCREHV